MINVIVHFSLLLTVTFIMLLLQFLNVLKKIVLNKQLHFICT